MNYADIMKQIGYALTVGLCILAACGAEGEPPAHAPLQQIYDDAWEFRLRENPLFATTVGVHKYNDRLPPAGIEDVERRAEYWQGVLESLDGYSRDSLQDTERINYDIFRRQVEDRLSEFGFKEYLIPLTSETGFHTSLTWLPEDMPFRTPQDYRNYISRLDGFPAYFAQHMERMRIGREQGYTLPRVVLNGYESTIRPHVVESEQESVFYAPFEDFPEGVPESEREALRESARTTIAKAVVPSYRRFLDFMTAEYIPGCRDSLGASELPNGEDHYAYLIRHHTTLDLTAEEVHRIGVEEVARIRGEMDGVIRQVGFKGDFAAFLRFLRTDPRFYPDTPEQLLKEAAWIAKRMDGKLPSLFKTLPRLPYTVAPVPDHIAPKYTAGRYVGAPLGSTQPGFYWVNTYNLNSRPLYALPALTLHEAVPGHHLQNALRQELDDLPNFRRFSGINAFGEGWGLYSEYLGIETGFYEDPYDNFGRLTYEMWRACRLVVDTGLHAKGWTRREALDYLASNTALSLHEVETETDRYISWPGQALAYKMGELKIKDLRSKAEAALGARFDIREFHDTILLNGPVPLDVLEDQVDAYIRAARGSF